ncbi:MAG: hypothetical protein IIC35_08925 [Gemmatimonadetes bacterium]|nr:hypothetical protein [Gemmatimonadota bacterium]
MSWQADHSGADRALRALRRLTLVCLGCTTIVSACGDERETVTGPPRPLTDAELNRLLVAELEGHGFTGRMEEQLEIRLGRPIDRRLAEVGRLLFFDRILSLGSANSCSGCHGPNMSFNDSKSISIGVGNNGIVGVGRQGPHNLRRAPSLINVAFYPKLMWDGRFRSNSLDPFDNSSGFSFPEPEGSSLSHLDHLLGAQVFTPVVSEVEMAGFGFQGDNVSIREELARRVDAVGAYRDSFAEIFPDVDGGSPLTFEHIAAAIAEFTFTLVRANAPIDEFARGDTSALTANEKRGALLFFGSKASCFECHIGELFANEMFSDFDAHVLAVPQVVPLNTNVVYDGPGANEDYGLERHTGDPFDRYKFRTSPLRNVAYQPSFMHNGAFVCLENAIRHHVDVFESLANYSTERLDVGLHGPLGPVQPMLDRVHPLSGTPRDLSDEEVRHITDFVRFALADPDAHPDRLRSLVPLTVPSGLAVHDFDFTVSAVDCF